MKYNLLTSKNISSFKNAVPKRGDIWWTNRLAFTNGIDGKERPVLILQDCGSDVKCFKCTTKNSDFRDRYEICDLLEAGLERTTYVDLEVHLLPKTKLSRRIGRLSFEDSKNLRLIRE